MWQGITQAFEKAAIRWGETILCEAIWDIGLVLPDVPLFRKFYLASANLEHSLDYYFVPVLSLLR